MWLLLWFQYHTQFWKLSVAFVKGVALPVAVLIGILSYCSLLLLYLPWVFILFDVHFTLLASYSEDFEEVTDTNPALKTEGDQVNQNIMSEVDLSPQEQV